MDGMCVALSKKSLQQNIKDKGFSPHVIYTLYLCFSVHYSDKITVAELVACLWGLFIVSILILVTLTDLKQSYETEPEHNQQTNL